MLIAICIAMLGIAVEPMPDGQAAIRAKAGASEIVVTTTSRLSGAIHSLTWNGKEFIDSLDHGRQMQSASSFDCAKPGPFWAECYNPTEAGSRKDGAGKTSTSRLLKIEATDNFLRTTSQSAFWLAPREKSEGRDALNDRVVSAHRVSKKVTIGRKNHPHVIEYDVTFHVPEGEKHTYAQFEAVTGYMPAEFSTFWKYLPNEKKLAAIEPGQGEQQYPVILATADGKYAMGIYSPDQPSKGFENAGYGRFRFEKEKVVKWNSVFRYRDAAGIKPGDYSFRNFVFVGTLDDVTKSMTAIVDEYAKNDK